MAPRRCDVRALAMDRWILLLTSIVTLLLLAGVVQYLVAAPAAPPVPPAPGPGLVAVGLAALGGSLLAAAGLLRGGPRAR